jgi:amidase
MSTSEPQTADSPAAPTRRSDDLVFTPAHALALRIRQRDVAATEVVEALLAHIAHHNARLNAIVTLDEHAARVRAQEADAALARGEIWGPLHGVPVTLKDFHLTAGMRTTWGNRALAHYIPAQDSAVPAKLKAAGAIILGKTNLDLGFPDNPLPRANNPWDLERTPGGSSTGPAAAVAAGLTPLDIASDALGSILNPAHYCGIFGMRPTEGRVSLAGLAGADLPDKYRLWRIIMALGPIARSVQDLRLALQIITGPDGQDFTVPLVPWREVPQGTIRDLRVAWVPSFGTPIAADIAAAVEGLARELEALGARVEQRAPEVDFIEQVRLSNELFSMLVGASDPLAEDPAAPRLSTYLRALERRDGFTAVWERFFGDWDVFVCPLDPITAPRHSEEDAPLMVEGTLISPEQRKVPFAISPIMGGPAITIPLGQDRNRLPIGALLVGRRWEDERLLAIADLLVAMTGGYRRPPGF